MFAKLFETGQTQQASNDTIHVDSIGYSTQK